MKTKLLFLTIFCIFIVQSIAGQENETVAGQENKKTYRWTTLYEVRANNSLNNRSDYASCEFTLAPGYRITPRLVIRIPVDISISLFNPNSTKNFEIQSTLGLNLGYNFNVSKYSIIEVNLTGGSTYVDINNWNYAYADIGLKWGSSRKHRYNPYLAFGYRTLMPYHDSFSTKHMFYVAFGIWMF